ncbi:VOC family protein [Sporichthya brevicatena]|uniref:VOC family protein n=1 Tax=Sporichthya brevicatena TaxID=171442 RepID=A0ABP3RZB1_9ACTN
MDVLSSRVLVRPTDHARSRHFYEETLGLAVFREFGPADHPGVVFHLGNGLLELSGSSESGPNDAIAMWIQVRNVHKQHERLERAGVPILRPPVQEPWGLIECWIADPDGMKIVLVEVPADHPLRRDQRP